MRKRSKQFGQGMTEYIIIVALIALAAIAVYGFFGKTLRNQVAGMSQELAGQKNTGTSAASSSAGSAASSANKSQGLKDYGSSN
ncbi:MAG: pilus assembly protein [Gammaproteobacteria bacterium]|jgi:Flp pilus assembly pilin Flp